jgi:solute carrier family 25 (mitochondrial uncoupling protein), member 8/9
MSGVKTTQVPFAPTLVCAGLGGSTAEILTIPFDTMKVRLQLSQKGGTGQRYSGLLDCGRSMIKQEGPLSLYKGLTPGIHRQLVFCSLRIALFEEFTEIVRGDGVNTPKKDLSFLQKLIIGLSSGALAISVANPTDVVKIRLQGDRNSSQPRYKNTTTAYTKILSEEGLKGFWTGWGPNVVRNAVINAAEMISYTEIKKYFLKHNIMDDGVPLHLTAGFLAGFCAVCCGSPVDVMKTRIMNAKKGTGEVYKSVADCFVKILTNEGLLAFYNGFAANVLRIGTWNMFMFFAYESFKRLYKSLLLDQK